MSQLPSQLWLRILECYDELLVDPALLQSFPMDEWTSINKLPCLSALHFRVVSEGLFSSLISPELLGQTRANFITSSAKNVMSEEIVPMAILITDGVSKGGLGMVTIFCHFDQVNVEPSVMLLTLIHWVSPEPAMVVMKIFTNSPYFPWGSFSLPFLDMATLTAGASTTWFHLSWLHLCWLLQCSPTQVILPEEKEGDRLMFIPFTKEALWESSIEDHHLSSLVPLSILSTSSHANTTKALNFGAALRHLQVVTQAKAQFEQELLY